MQKTVIGRPRPPKESAPPVGRTSSVRRESADFLFGIGLITAALLLFFPMLEGSQTAVSQTEAIPVMSGAVTESPEETESPETTDRMAPKKIDELAKPERRTSAPANDSFYDRIGALFAELIFGFSE